MLAINFQSVFPFFTTFFSLLFFLSVMEQYQRKHKFHQLIWGIAMLLFLLTAGAEALALALGFWDPTVYKIYYVLAAIQVPFMGGGVLYLFAERNIVNSNNSWKALIVFSLIWSLFGFLFSARDSVFFVFFIIGVSLIVLSLASVIIPSSSFKDWWKEKVTGWTVANIFMGVSLLAFILMTYYAIISPLNLDILKQGGEVSGLPWQKDPSNLNEPRAIVRLFSPLQTVPGGIALIGGGFYSYISWQLSIKKQSGKFDLKKGLFNVYIAVGALILGQGAFLSGFGYGTLYISETISVALMYFGFLESDRITKEQLLNVINLKRYIVKPSGN